MRLRRIEFYLNDTVLLHSLAWLPPVFLGHFLKNSTKQRIVYTRAVFCLGRCEPWMASMSLHGRIHGVPKQNTASGVHKNARSMRIFVLYKKLGTAMYILSSPMFFFVFYVIMSSILFSSLSNLSFCSTFHDQGYRKTLTNIGFKFRRIERG